MNKDNVYQRIGVKFYSPEWERLNLKANLLGVTPSRWLMLKCEEVVKKHRKIKPFDRTPFKKQGLAEAHSLCLHRVILQSIKKDMLVYGDWEERSPKLTRYIVDLIFDDE